MLRAKVGIDFVNELAHLTLDYENDGPMQGLTHDLLEGADHEEGGAGDHIGQEELKYEADDGPRNEERREWQDGAMEK